MLSLLLNALLLCAEKSMPVTTNEMLLRGCMLKNSNYVLGLVVYTGKESRIQMNAAKTPNKVGETPLLECALLDTVAVHADYFRRLKQPPQLPH